MTRPGIALSFTVLSGNITPKGIMSRKSLFGQDDFKDGDDCGETAV